MTRSSAFVEKCVVPISAFRVPNECSMARRRIVVHLYSWIGGLNLYRHRQILKSAKRESTIPNEGKRHLKADQLEYSLTLTIFWDPASRLVAPWQAWLSSPPVSLRPGGMMTPRSILQHSGRKSRQVRSTPAKSRPTTPEVPLVESGGLHGARFEHENDLPEYDQRLTGRSLVCWSILGGARARPT